MAKRKSSRKKKTEAGIFLKAWQEVSLILASEVSLEEMLRRCLRAAAEAIGAKYATIMVEKAGNLIIIADYGFPDDYVKYLAEEQRAGRLPANLGESPSGIAYQKEKQVVTKNIYTEPRWKIFKYVGQHYRYGSLLYTPLKPKEKAKPFGLLILYKEKTYKTDEEAFPKVEREFIKTIARPAAVAIQNVKLYEELKNLSETLAQKVKARTSELEKEKEEAEKTKKATLNILEDVEEARRRAEEEKNKTLAIITNFTDGLLVLDRNNRISLVNPWGERLLGIKAEDLLDKSFQELSELANLKPLISLLRKEEPARIIRAELSLRKDLTVEVSTVPIMREKEKAETLVILHNVTREKMIEKMKTEFVSLAAHQLRTPLSAIKWTLRMLLDGDLGKITEEQRELIERTYRSNERMIALINDLLNVTRIEEGRYLYKPTLSYLEEVVQFVINSYREEIKRRKLTLEFKKPETRLPQLKIDVEKIRLATQNLLDNAVRYTRPGGRVTVSLKHVRNKVEFSIKDTGIGIPEDQQKRVFTKFFRGANALRMETQGSGLGLFITKNIIEAHGGKIWFESKEGQGTTFYFSLPIQ